MLTVVLLGVAFVASHFLMSLSEVREPLVARLGEGGFLVAYSLVAGVLMVLFIMSYGEANRSAYWWYPDPNAYLVAMIVMWFSVVLVVGSFLSPNPSSVGMGAKAKEGPQGVLRITRHPMLWGIGLWSLSHILANGDVASVFFFLGFAMLSFLGIWVLDQKKAQQLGDDWSHYTSQTSLLPFAAILSGRTAFVFAELVVPLAVGSAVYVAIFWTHQWLSGVEIVLP